MAEDQQQEERFKRSPEWTGLRTHRCCEAKTRDWPSPLVLDGDESICDWCGAINLFMTEADGGLSKTEHLERTESLYKEALSHGSEKVANLMQFKLKHFDALFDIALHLGIIVRV